MENEPKKFDIDKWMNLYKKDKEAFEQKRKEVLEQAILNSTPENQKRLQGLQFQVDAIRKTSKNPIHGYVRISKLMWESFEKLKNALNKNI